MMYVAFRRRGRLRSHVWRYLNMQHGMMRVAFRRRGRLRSHVWRYLNMQLGMMYVAFRRRGRLRSHVWRYLNMLHGMRIAAFRRRGRLRSHVPRSHVYACAPMSPFVMRAGRPYSQAQKKGGDCSPPFNLKLVTLNYLRVILRLAIMPRPTMPVPRSIMEPGSGTVLQSSHMVTFLEPSMKTTKSA